ncbi:DUF2510 domain-containing protein [Streptomyces sp. INA 01156]
MVPPTHPQQIRDDGHERPTPAPGDDTPREGYYPDPSIPGYVRYWNGAAWVPGTSRPAPEGGGAPLAPAASAGTAPAPSAEETGPHFFDEDPADEPSPFSSPFPSSSPSSPPSPSPSPAESQHGSLRARLRLGRRPLPPVGLRRRPGPPGLLARTESAARPRSGRRRAPPDNEFVSTRLRRSRPPRPPPLWARPSSGGAPAEEGTMTFRAACPRKGPSGGPGFGLARPPPRVPPAPPPPRRRTGVRSPPPRLPLRRPFLRRPSLRRPPLRSAPPLPPPDPAAGLSSGPGGSPPGRSR